MIYPGRFSAHIEGAFVVFLIGMRVNNLLHVRKWVQTAMAMPPMLETLYQHRDKGFLGGEQLLFWQGVLLVQYWRSFEQLEHFARSQEDPHLAAWRRFNQTIGGDGSVGIFHETYLVETGRYECVYGNMPRFGLGKAAEHVPAVGKRETARQRLGGDDEPALPSQK